MSCSIIKDERKIIEELKKYSYVYVDKRKINLAESNKDDLVNIVFFQKNYDGILMFKRSLFWKPQIFYKDLEDILTILDDVFFNDGEEAVVLSFEKKDVNEELLRRNCMVNQNGDYYWL